MEYLFHVPYLTLFALQRTRSTVLRQMELILRGQIVADYKFYNLMLRHTFSRFLLWGPAVFFAAICGGIVACCAVLCGAERLSGGS